MCFKTKFPNAKCKQIQQIKSTPKTLYFKNATTQTGTDSSASKLVYFKKFGAEVPNVAKKVQADFYFVEEEISQIEINEDEISDYLKENYEIAQIQDINEDNEFRDFNNQDKDGKEDQFVKVVKEDQIVNENQVTDQNQMKKEDNVEEIQTGLDLPNKEQPKSNKSKEEVVEEIILEMKSSQSFKDGSSQPSKKEQPKTSKTLGITKEDTKRTVAKDTKPQKPKKQEERRELGMAESKGGAFGSCAPRTRQPAQQNAQQIQPQVQSLARRQNRMLTDNEPMQQQQQQQQFGAFGARQDFMVPPPPAQHMQQNNIAQLQQQQFAVNAQQRLIAPPHAPVPQQNMVQMQFMSQQSQMPVQPPVVASKSLLASSSQFKASKQAPPPPQDESRPMMKKKVATQAQSKKQKEVQHFQEQEEEKEGYQDDDEDDYFQEREEQLMYCNIQPVFDEAPQNVQFQTEYQMNEIVPIENEEQQYFFEPEQNENQNEIMKSPMQFADDFALLEPLFGLFDDNDVSVQTASFSVSSTQQQQQQQNQQANQQYGQVFNGQNNGQNNQQCGQNNQNSQQNSQQFSNQFSNQNSQNNTSMSVSGKEKQSMYQIEQFGQQLLVFINEYFKSQFNGLKEALVYYKQYTRQNGTRVKLNFKKLGDMFNISADDSYNRFEQILQQNLDTWDTDQVKAVKAEVKRQFELTKGMSKKDRAFQIRKQVNTILALEDQVEKNYKQIANVINYQITVLEKSL
ncbi:Hypothetical_protein [Hexamita inflata]|uniref:Hypothetical_protein n=1 Tax=Hexamita inflata TaxID=28002 RepID=A0AA86UIA1_9EUKA|nr:Hypothetical protein HINF_LOCUS39932 [Hexamita inflata]